MKSLAKTLMAAACVVLATGCASTTSLNSDGHVAFGKFNLISNGHAVDLGHTVFDRHAYVQVRNANNRKLYSGKVGQGGQFAMQLPAGDYLLEKIVFEHHNEKIESDTSFRFTIPEQYRSVYLGTVTLEASLETGIYGVVGTADRYTITDDCSSGCDDQLATLQLPARTSGVSLMSWDHQMAQSR